MPATLNPVGQAPVTIVSSGFFIPTSGNNVAGNGTYTWPGGWWPSTDGSGREGNIHTALAVCAFGPAGAGFWTLYVTFYRFYGDIRKPTSGSGGDAGGGGGGPGGASCHMEFITVEVDNGSGYKDFWSGMANVCS